MYGSVHIRRAPRLKKTFSKNSSDFKHVHKLTQPKALAAKTIHLHLGSGELDEDLNRYGLGSALT